MLNEERRNARCELEVISFRKFQMDSQKAKVRWLRKEIRTLNFSHTLLNNRRNKSILDKLEMDYGSVVLEEGQIVETRLGFYTNLYRKSEGEGGVSMGWSGVR